MQNVTTEDTASFSSKEMHKMVVEAHIFCKKRGQSEFNANLEDKDIEKFCKMEEKASQSLQIAVNRFSLTFRSIKKIQKVARTIADLDRSEEIKNKHLLEALSYRRR